MMTPLHYISIDSPAGPLLLCASRKGLCHIEFGRPEDALPKLRAWAKRHYGADADFAEAPQDAVLQEAAAQLSQYFAGTRREFALELDLRGTPFQRKVWLALAAIPFGETRSYKEIAAAVQAPKAVRAVGGANNRNPLPFVVPCHRVIGADGQLVGYGGGLHIKRYLLRHEGWEPTNQQRGVRS